MTGKFDLDLINQAPTTPSALGEDSKADLQELRHANSVLQDENDALKQEISVESQKARLLIPYANKVFWFCVISLMSFQNVGLH